MKKILLAFAIVTILAGCAPQQERIKTTTSGNPEAYFAGASLSNVRNKLIGACDSKGIPVMESSDNSVVCGKEMSGGEAAFAQILIGNSYSTTPWRKVRFTIYQSGKGVKVSSRQWIETQMAFGQMRQQELNSNNQFNDVQRLLNSIGGK